MIVFSYSRNIMTNYSFSQHFTRCNFLDADDFHSTENKQKMAAGTVHTYAKQNQGLGQYFKILNPTKG